MSEYLEKAKVIELIREVKSQVSEDSETTIADYEDGLIESINKAQTADVAPVVHGRWKVVYNSVGKQEGQCTHCGKNSGILITKKSYCPNCGAKMGKEAQNEEKTNA